MPYRLQFRMLDNNGKEAYWSVNLAEITPLSSVDALVSSLRSPALALSSCTFADATYVQRFDEGTPTPIRGPSSSYDRLLVLCTNGVDYAGITIPAPSPQPYMATGPHRGFKVDNSLVAPGAALRQLVQLLGQTLTESGAPFPQGEFLAALMVNQP